MSSESCFKGSISIGAGRAKVGFTSAFAQNQDSNLKSSTVGGFKPVENSSTTSLDLSNKEKVPSTTINTFTSVDANSIGTSSSSSNITTKNKPYSFSFKSINKDVGISKVHEKNKKENAKQSCSPPNNFHASVDPPPPPPDNSSTDPPLPPPPVSSQPARSLIKFSFGAKKK